MSTTSRRAMGASRGSHNGYTASRTAVVGFAKVLFMGLSQASTTAAAPLAYFMSKKDDEAPDAEDPDLWLYLTVAMVLVLLGGAFAGLTIALMGQDGIYLQVIATSGEGKEQKHAQKVYRLLKRGKHWVLVTLLLSNVIVNETLPIVLDRSLGGGWPAVLGSTVLIVIFGEVIPQSICVRYGLQIGAFMAPFVLGLMYILAPVAWPTAKLLDWALGEDHGTVYKKSGLKTLVTLHKTLGTSPGDRLNQDEVTIISAVLDLKDKAVGNIMTPMEDVFTMSADTVLDEKMMDVILSAGYSRIPIFEPGNENNFVGMLLVKILITYDPEDGKKVSEFALATLPETRPETSCLDIVNFFQEGKSHMVLVSDFPGENYGATGVVTLEDVIEELIGEEIIDESDVYVDVHKAIRRLAPAPRARVGKGQVVDDPDGPEITEDDLLEFVEENPETATRPDVLTNRLSTMSARDGSPVVMGSSPKATFMRRSSSGADGRVNVRGTAADMREHLKHLGPSNHASHPKTTRYNTVKIKPGPIKTPEGFARPGSIVEEPYTDHPGGEGVGLLTNAGRDASDGILSLHQGYGSMSAGSPSKSTKSTQVNLGEQKDGGNSRPTTPLRPSTRRAISGDSAKTNDTLGSLHSVSDSRPTQNRSVARSGSITENVVDSHGVRKVVLETNSSSEDADTSSKKKEALPHSKANGSTSSLLSGNDDNSGNGLDSAAHDIMSSSGHSGTISEVKKKKNRRKQKKKVGPSGGASRR